MILRIRSTQDLWAGILFVVVGLGTVAIGLGYPMGTTRNIGPGYFPVLLGGVLAAIGIGVGIKGLAADAEPLEPFALRPLLIISASVVAFAMLVRPFGLAVATIALILISAFAGGGFSARRIVLLALGLSAMAWLIFIRLLGLPFNLWPW